MTSNAQLIEKAIGLKPQVIVSSSDKKRDRVFSALVELMAKCPSAQELESYEIKPLLRGIVIGGSLMLLCVTAEDAKKAGGLPRGFELTINTDFLHFY
jgi:hypothetical protein